jgi:hypothetical protein
MKNRFFDKLSRISKYDPINMFWVFLVVWSVEQVTSRMIEILLWGNAFQHWGDVAFTLALFAAYVICADAMATRIHVAFTGAHELGDCAVALLNEADHTVMWESNHGLRSDFQIDVEDILRRARGA